MKLYAETLLARVMGIKRPQIAAARLAHTVKGTDWLVENSTVQITEVGLGKIASALGVDLSALRWEAPDSAPPVTEPALDPSSGGVDPAALENDEPEKIESVMGAGDVVTQELAAAAEKLKAEAGLRVEIVVVRRSANPRVLIGRLADNSGAVVAVRDSTNFLPGMKLTATRVDGEYYRMEGNCPRWRGRW